MESSPQPTNQPVLQVIMFADYETLRPMGLWLKANALQYLIGEHPADETVNRTHCHILIEGLKVTAEGLRKEIKKYVQGAGQYCILTKTQEKPRLPYKRHELAKYIIKGDLNHYKESSFCDISIATWCSEWIKYSQVRPSPEVTTVGEAPTKKKEPTKYENCWEIIEQYLQGVDLTTRDNRQTILKAIIAWANKNRKAMHIHLVGEYSDCILMQAVPEFYSTLCVDYLNNRYKHSF